jgi:hypothetical protein
LDMCRKHPEFSYSAPSDASDVLLRQVPDEEEDEEEEDDDKDDNDDDEEGGDGYSASSCFSAGRLIQRASHEWLRFFDCRAASQKTLLIKVQNAFATPTSLYSCAVSSGFISSGSNSADSALVTVALWRSDTQRSET